MTASQLERSPLLGLSLPEDFVMDRALVEWDLRVLGKAEQIPAGRLPEEQEAIHAKGLKSRAVESPEPGFFVLYYAKSESVLDTAHHLEHEQRVRDDEDRRQAAAAKLGSLLGYPECCVQRFTSAASHRDHDIFRSRGGGLDQPAQTIANFFLRDAAPMGFVPCTLDCSAASARALEILNKACAMHALNGAHYRAALRSVIFWFAGPFFVEFLNPSEITKSGFNYEAVSSSLERCRLFPEHHEHPLAREAMRWEKRLKDTNRLELTPTSVVVYEGGQRGAQYPLPDHPHGWFAFTRDEV